MRRAGSYKKDDEGNLVRIEQTPPAAPTETETKPVAPKKTTKKPR